MGTLVGSTGGKVPLAGGNSEVMLYRAGRRTISRREIAVPDGPSPPLQARTQVDGNFGLRSNHLRQDLSAPLRWRKGEGLSTASGIGGFSLPGGLLLQKARAMKFGDLPEGINLIFPTQIDDLLQGSLSVKEFEEGL